MNMKQIFSNDTKAKIRGIFGKHCRPQDRLLTELAILLERGDIHEELDRLEYSYRKISETVASDRTCWSRAGISCCKK